MVFRAVHQPRRSLMNHKSTVSQLHSCQPRTREACDRWVGHASCSENDSVAESRASEFVLVSRWHGSGGRRVRGHRRAPPFTLST
jgi:hypothetical protein